MGKGTADLYLVLDALGGVSPTNLDRTHSERTAAIVNTTPNPTGEMVRDNSILFPSDASIQTSIDQHTHSELNQYVDAGTIAEGLFGDHMNTNMFLVGIAYQHGLIPLQAESIEGAIELNGVAISQNQQAFRYGRRFVHNPDAVAEISVPRDRTLADERASMTDYLTQAYGAAAASAYQQQLERCKGLAEEAQRRLAIRIGELIAYQDANYATQYVDDVLKVANREAEATPGHSELTYAVIQYLYKLMAYKDEYEVARLHLKPSWQNQLDEMFDKPVRISYNLHPPMLRALGMKSKLKLGPWFNGPLGLLTKLKRLRGTPLDVFGYAKARREERQLIPWYRETIEQLLNRLSSENHGIALAIATAPDAIRGYEDVKSARVAEAKESVAKQLERFNAGATQAPETLSFHPTV